MVHSNKPNVLIIFTDQQRFDTIHQAGYGHMITPNLDRLAREGCLYSHAYSTNPVCMAARHDLLTGLPGRAHGFYANAQQPIKDYSLPTIARSFSENGYRTAAIGKMHFRPVRMHHGYNELILMEEIPKNWRDDQYAAYLRQEGLGHVQNIHGVRANLYHTPQMSQMDDAHHPNRWVADRTIQWLKENGEHSFFLFCSWIHPHPPWATPKEFQGLYRDRKWPAPAPNARSYPFVEGDSPWHGDDDTAEEIRAVQEAYYSCITHVDHSIGKLLDFLEEQRKIDNTLIIFTSDHGEMLYDRGMHQKSLPYEGSAHVPMIVRYPDKVAKGSVNHDFVDLFDLFPTCLDVCGLDMPQGKYALVGESLFAAQPRRDRTHQISHNGEGVMRWVMNRDERYKFIYYYNQGVEECYDLLQDPQELTNIAGTERVPAEVFQRLKAQAIAFEEAWGPEGMAVNGDFRKVDGERYEPKVRAMHGNVQFHIMDERSPLERGQRFVEECEYAMTAEGNRGKLVQEVFNEPAYIRAFMEKWVSFGGATSMGEYLFSMNQATREEPSE